MTICYKRLLPQSAISFITRSYTIYTRQRGFCFKKEGAPFETPSFVLSYTEDKIFLKVPAFSYL
jgi:hypothetical protein